MCVGENCAPQATRYIQAQLLALYENAQDCIELHQDANVQELDYRLSHSLVEYQQSRPLARQDTTSRAVFEATFDPPEIWFICDHDACFRVKISEGSYSPGSAGPGRTPLENLPIDDLQIEFRVNYDIRDLSGVDSRIGTGKMRLLILDFSNAKLMSMAPSISMGKDTLLSYLVKYLEFLQSAGRHVFFSLPEFTARPSLTINHSAMSSSSPDVQELQHVPIETINTQLALNWLKAAMDSIEPVGRAVDWPVINMAEFRGFWSPDEPLSSEAQFQIRFGAPRIMGVCSQEAIMCFSLDEVSFYEGKDDILDQTPSRSYSKWEVAFLVKITRVDETEGGAYRCVINLYDTQIRDDLSKFEGLSGDDDMGNAYCDLLLQAIEEEYLRALAVDSQLIIYDSRWSTSAWTSLEDSLDNDEDVSSWHLDSSDTGAISNRLQLWRRTIKESDMGTFDQIIAISQSSLNIHFNKLHASALPRSLTYPLANWTSDQTFTATFQPINVRLLSEDRAIVWIHLTKGQIKLLTKDPSVTEERHQFEDWRLAFEVTIKIASHVDILGNDQPPRWTQEPFPCKQHVGKDDRYLRHIYLDFRNAEFIHEYSRFDDLLHTQSSRPIEKLRAMVYYLRTQYFPALMDRGVHILHTVPVWTSEKDCPTYAFTDVAFHIYSSATISRQSLTSVTDILEPAIIVLGMTNFHRMLHRRLAYSADWVIRANKGATYGTLALSREVFLERAILKSLSGINAMTTVIPLVSPVDENGTWSPRLSTWALDEQHKSQECRWISQTPDADGRLKYEWNHHVDFKYEHKGSGVVMGAHAVACTTNNRLQLPPATRSGRFEIKISGKVLLNVSFASENQKASAKFSAEWSASLVLQTDTSGIKASLQGSPSPTFDGVCFEGEAEELLTTDLESQLRALFPDTISLDDVLDELKQFEGIWQTAYPGMKAHCLVNPIFNSHGDLLFELQPHTILQAQSIPGPARPSGANRPRRRWNDGTAANRGTTDSSRVRHE
ncbi:hypothetical protein IEO21_00037 [Rhodonia placenta]|uniref:Uncharacterized protein n=1 Tax=Rhodonia placenta TaxID=104341 RepID=A0A8H7U6X8_9APHY|nr:hypothetical protein IEO21_00037 [Postia placenta]